MFEELQLIFINNNNFVLLFLIHNKPLMLPNLYENSIFPITANTMASFITSEISKLLVSLKLSTRKIWKVMEQFSGLHLMYTEYFDLTDNIFYE